MLSGHVQLFFFNLILILGTESSGLLSLLIPKVTGAATFGIQR